LPGNFRGNLYSKVLDEINSRLPLFGRRERVLGFIPLRVEVGAPGDRRPPQLCSILPGQMRILPRTLRRGRFSWLPPTGCFLQAGMQQAVSEWLVV